MLKFLLVLVMFLSFTGEAVADAKRVYALQMALTERFGAPCQHQMIKFRRTPLPGLSIGQARWLQWPSGKQTLCAIHYDEGAYISDELFCSVGAHEWLHLRKYRPPPKYRINGDKYHSSNSASLMHPLMKDIWGPCKGWSAKNWHLT